MMQTQTGDHNMTDYEAERRSFRLDAPADFNWAFDVIDRWAADPQALAMHWVGPQGEEHHITFEQFRQRSNQVANALESLGVRRGDRVFLMLPRVVEWWESILGIMRIGAVSMPGTTLLTPKDIVYRANLAETRVVITDAAGASKFDEVRAQCPSIEVLIVVGEACDGWHSYATLVDAASDQRDRLAT